MPARHDAEKRQTRARRPTGKPRKKGPKGLNLSRTNDVLDVMVTHFDNVYRELNDHLRRIAKIQQRVNELFATVERLSQR